MEETENPVINFAGNFTSINNYVGRLPWSNMQVHGRFHVPSSNLAAEIGCNIWRMFYPYSVHAEKNLNYCLKLCHDWLLQLSLRFIFSWHNSPSGPRPPHFRGSMITLRHTKHGRTPLDEWSARRRDLYPTTHNTHKRKTSMPPAGFEPTIQQENGRRTTP